MKVDDSSSDGDCFFSLLFADLPKLMLMADHETEVVYMDYLKVEAVFLC